MATPPPLNFTVRGSDGLSLRTGPPSSGMPTATVESRGTDGIVEMGSRQLVASMRRILCSASPFSRDGSRLAATSLNAVVIYDTDYG
uniref:Uncharacterized protein n=1 Tax=Physcomitrium patens TaxID=3218 RepID=A0A7I4DPG7_PHYPA